MDTTGKIAVMQAFVDGKLIQLRRRNDWVDLDGPPNWDWVSHNYRIKPEPEVVYVNKWGTGNKTLFSYPSEQRAKESASGGGFENYTYIAKKFVEVVE